MEKRIKKSSRNMQDQTHKKINLDDRYESFKKGGTSNSNQHKSQGKDNNHIQ